MRVNSLKHANKYISFFGKVNNSLMFLSFTYFYVLKILKFGFPYARVVMFWY